MKYNKIDYDLGNYKSPIRCYCDKCGKEFLKRKALLNFKLSHSPKSKLFCDDICQSQFRAINHGATQCKHCSADITRTYSTQKFCSQSCAAFYNNSQKDFAAQWTLERRKHHADKARENGFGFASTAYRKSKVSLVAVICNCCKQSFHVKPYLAKSRKFCSKKCAGQHNYHPNSTKATKCSYNGVSLDSGAELAFAQLLDKNQIKWVKNQIQAFSFKDESGKDRKYYPDFFLPDYDQWIEIKGKKYSRSDDHLRLAAVGNIELIFSHELRLPNCIQSVTAMHLP